MIHTLFLDCNYYFNSYIENVESVVPLTISCPVKTKFMQEYENSIFRLLFDKTTRQTNVYWSFVTYSSNESIVIDRLNTNPNGVVSYVSNIDGDDKLNISDLDITMLTILLQYRLGMEILIPDSILYNDLSDLGKLIYLYLNYLISGDVSYINELMVLSSFPFMYLYLFKWFVMNELMLDIRSKSNISNNEYVELTEKRIVSLNIESVPFEIELVDRYKDSDINVYVNGVIYTNYEIIDVSSTIEKISLVNILTGDDVLVCYYISE